VKPPEGGLVALVLDGHECACSDRQRWGGCLKRDIQTRDKSTLQYYQRIVVASLVFQGGCLLLDAEIQKPGEDEVAAATRLFQRVVEAFPRAFRVVVADGLYARADFFQQVLAHHKDIIAVLKDERRDLLTDARSLFDPVKPVTFVQGKTRYQCWDIEGLTSWPSLARPVRVVRKPGDHAHEAPARQERSRADRRVDLGDHPLGPARLHPHRRASRSWPMVHRERRGLHELVNLWKADHVYKHHANAILAFWLLTLLAYDLFHSFHRLNLKPALRLRLTLGYLLDLVTTDFYQHEDLQRSHPP